MDTTGLTNMQCLKRYFEIPTVTGCEPKPLSMGELKALTSEERDELGRLARAALEELQG